MFNNNQPRSPWLKSERQLNVDPSASFVEYLRWMRSPDTEESETTQVQILQMAAENGRGYKQRLEILNNRIKQIAGETNTFLVECPWRLRVGGQRGPENILLPAFDALGIPYIPSSTLRGIARNQAIREIMLKNNIGDWKEAEKQVAPWFGSLEEKGMDRAGKVIFLDAYPEPNQGSILAVDMVNNIWNWNENVVVYKPNPNHFLSLKKPSFIIGLKRTSICNDNIFDQIKSWLIKGLQSGIGSQVNTGYGELIEKGKINQLEGFLQVKFTLEGQLIHGCQRITWNREKGEYQSAAEPEVRPVAFKSMLRYWFRVFALRFLPANEVKQWEHNLFGSLKFKSQGWVNFRIKELMNPRSGEQGKTAPCLRQSGILKLSFSQQVPNEHKTTIENLFKSLTWLMFHLGGVGQGARRPLYSRKNRPNGKPPWYRGVKLNADRDDLFQELPRKPEEFKKIFEGKLQDFYKNLKEITGNIIALNLPLSTKLSSEKNWNEIVDNNCQIVVCSGNYNQEFGKPHALAVLHDTSLKNKGRYDSNICGESGDRSPIWIADLGNYQVVTVFGANEINRKNFLKLLKEKTDLKEYAQIQWEIK